MADVLWGKQTHVNTLKAEEDRIYQLATEYQEAASFYSEQGERLAQMLEENESDFDFTVSMYDDVVNRILETMNQSIACQETGIGLLKKYTKIRAKRERLEKRLRPLRHVKK